MYDALTTRELNVLQNMLFEGTEETFRISNLGRDNPEWIGSYRPLHREVAHLFIEAGTELLGRFGEQVPDSHAPDSHVRAA